MADQRNPAGRGGSNNPRNTSRPNTGRPSSGRPSSGGKPTSGSRSGKPTTGGPRTPGSGSRPNPGSGQRPKPGSGQRPDRGAKPTGSRPDRGSSRPDRRPSAAERTESQKVYDGPQIPDDVSAKDLDKYARAELQGLPDKLADKVARHLVMAGILLHEDPELAHKHALAARTRAMRVGLVREATGETAYACGNWAEALAEFRAAKRMTGRHSYAPMMADAERALKRPEKALEYDTPATRAHLDEAGNTELSIVIAGARRDLGQTDAALQILEQEPLTTKARHDWVTRLRYAYADTLHHAGRTQEAITWFH
ncbi:tetratricopeptide repeat protein, partial [Aeromicrobium flavum]